ncbi:MAG: DUF2927 domain-containing protein [Pseudomonadota bacterium]
MTGTQGRPVTARDAPAGRRWPEVRAFALAAAAALAGCTLAPASEPARRDMTGLGTALPPARTFGPPPARPVAGSEAGLAADFLDLAFRMESGRPVPALSRFEGPVRVRTAGTVPPLAEADLARLIGRLRSEAGIDIARAADGVADGVADGAADGRANLTVEFLPRRTISALVPQAACFVAPNVGSWAEYRRARRTGRTDWTGLRVRERIAVFIPGDVAPQEVRDCLNEEIAQGLGPLNDLYRLPESVFNDDNVQGVLTAFDMLMLRVYYAPEIFSGMTEAQAAAVVPSVLARLGYTPGGSGGAALRETPRAYVAAVETALGPRASAESRRSAAMRAVAIADARGWRDSRAGFAWFVLGRLSISGRPDVALDAFLRADAIFRSGRGMELQAANVSVQLAAFALSQGDAEQALTLTGQAAGAAMRGQNAALLFTLLTIRAEALDILGRTAEAASARTEALGWGRYGLGTAAEITTRASEIAALSPARRAATLRTLSQ